MIAALHAACADYGEGPVLGPLDLGLQAGETVALVGPSGCGKSTALRILAGLEAPTAGAVERSVERGRTGLVFQSPTLMPWATARANVALPLELEGVPAAEARAAAEAALERVGLSGAAGRKPAQLSGGMAMRVALARALVARPHLLLLDEPFAALDEITRRSLADDLLALWAADRPALLFVTHSVEEAVYMAQRVVVLSSCPGRLVADIPSPGPYPRPPGYRNAAIFRETVEAVSSALASGVAA